MLKYKGYMGQVTFDAEADIFHGEVMNTRDVITFQGRSVPEIKRAFRESVDDYLDFCRERGEQPNKPLKPELHREAFTSAKISGMSLNHWIAEAIARQARPSGD